MLLTTFLFSATHLTFGLMGSGEGEEANWFATIPLIFLGSSYALYSCVMIPSIQYIVPEKIVGTAFGLLGMFESVALAFFPILAGYIVEISDTPEEGYSMVGFFFSGISMMGILFTLSLYFFDKKGSLILDFVNPVEPSSLERMMMKTVKSESSSEEDESSDEEEEIFYTKRMVCKSYASLKSKKLMTSPMLRTLSMR